MKIFWEAGRFPCLTGKTTVYREENLWVKREAGRFICLFGKTQCRAE